MALHGSRTQAQRDRALQAFHAGTARVLVATDVAARGIHVENVACVLHFDPPSDHKDYVHRSGRTGRAGADGTVVSLVTPDQAGAARTVQRALGFPQVLEQPVSLPPVARRRRHAPTLRPRRRHLQDVTASAPTTPARADQDQATGARRSSGSCRSPRRVEG